MKTIHVVLASLLIGILLGVATAAIQLRSLWGHSEVERLMAAVHDPRQPELPPDGVGVPIAHVDEADHDFGVMERGTTLSYTFQIENRGNYPLALSQGDTTCKCTLSQVETQQVMPGESAGVTLEWNAETDAEYFREMANVLTNDPERRAIQLTVHGRVSESLEVRPRELVFSKVFNGEQATGQLRLTSHRETPTLEILETHWADDDTAKYFEVTTQPVPLDQLADSLAKSAVDVTVNVLPGLPVGRIDQGIELKTNIAAVKIPILVHVVSEISLFGNGWSEQSGILSLGGITSSEGLRRELALHVRGEDPGQIEFEVAEVWPDVLQVHLGEKQELVRGTLVQVPLVVEIPQGSRAVICYGTEQGDMGRIILKTNRPRVKEFRIPVRFAVVK